MKPAEMQNSLAADCTAIDKNRGKFNCFNRTAQFAHARSQTVTMPVQGISRPIIARTSPSTPQVTPHRVASDRARQAGKGRGLARSRLGSLTGKQPYHLHTEQPTLSGLFVDKRKLLDNCQLALRQPVSTATRPGDKHATRFVIGHDSAIKFLNMAKWRIVHAETRLNADIFTMKEGQQARDNVVHFSVQYVC